MKGFEYFGSRVFSESVMKERLPFPIYKKWKAATRKSDVLDTNTADAIAHAMKEWALEYGCTHYCHWFQPLSGSTAEKHDSFIDKSQGEPIVRFSGKALIKGEPDASSFPNGGLRATFEARGYTYWDCTSPAFIKDGVLCIPTVFVSYTGQVLDEKTPLLRSNDIISASATRIVNAFGDKDVREVKVTLGLEQEYFLVDEKIFNQRRDLFTCGRTLLGSLPAKGQELNDHYFGVIPERVQEFMNDINHHFWELGILSKTEHNEAAPNQFEVAPIFSDMNIAVDQNLIMMDVIRKTARKHGMVALLHEKPFAGVNGSGKHNNWSLITDDGQNLLDPGDKPHENVRFLLFVCAIIKAVDDNAELIRMASSCPGNDFRLGSSEAPPAIVSIFMGEQIEAILSSLETGRPAKYEQSALSSFGLSTLKTIPHDSSDRNRTSPVAFTGNKFEFRMLGSSLNPSFLNTVLNVAIGSVLEEIANRLETLKYRQEIREEAIIICSEIIKQHKRILFSGNGYSREWIEDEAVKRGLSNIHTFVESIECFNSPKSINLFEKFGILSADEIDARANVLYESYTNNILIEAKTLALMIRQDVIPSFVKEINDSHIHLKSKYLEQKSEMLVTAIDQLADFTDNLVGLMDSDKGHSPKEVAYFCLEKITPVMSDIRCLVDALEPYLATRNYPYPSYEEAFNSLD
ncbi:MAG: glutamine synthetase III [Erysipelotrichaceae bacterium]|nr:glutamine synthetase III [Erysipelotrichaceae bacterium]